MKRKSSAAAAAFQKFIRAKVPMTKAMGLSVVTCSSKKGVTLSLPLRPNRNHLLTAFGGSLVSAQAVACWGWLWQILRENKIDAEVVLKHQHAEFLLPVNRSFIISANPAPAAEVERFIETIRRHKKARIQVTARVLRGGRIAGQYVGEYVAVREL